MGDSFTEPECYCHLFLYEEERCLVCIEEGDRL